MSEMTFGQKAVGVSFNPSGDHAVNDCKAVYADIIDRLNDLRVGSTSDEVIRMADIAITSAQTSQMWAVKALTWRG